MQRRSRGLQLVVRARSARSSLGVLQVGQLTVRCALGRSGRRTIKREGDGATPIGVWPVREILYRPDRTLRPSAGLPVRRIAGTDGWCDEPKDRNYNRRVRLPYPASAEQMSRPDGLYDVVVVLGYNDRPRRRGAGSAIFIHGARSDFAPTAGCIALRLVDLLRLLRWMGPNSRVVVPYR
jgi:L,D-peptidoglycan transpeptidase YkuD (ErfK/YbiS/YcfS/YnhG family)